MTGFSQRRSRSVVRAASLALCLLGGGGAMAQQTATPAPAEASAAEPTASALAAARDVVVSSGMARSFLPMVPDLMRQIVPTVTRTHPELTADLNTVMQQLEPEFTKDGERMVDIAARVYARHMNEDELKQTAAFFKSPAGSKYVESQPQMLDELVVAMQSWTQQLSNIMLTRVREEMAKKGHQMM